MQNDVTLGHKLFVPVILVFSGTLMSSVMLGQVPDLLVSPMVILNYMLGNLLISSTPLGVFITSVIPPLPMEVFFAVLDGFARTFGCTAMGVDEVIHHQDPRVRNSLFAALFIPTLTGAGSALLVPLVDLFHPNWRLQTPDYLTKFPPSIDIWSAPLIAAVYSFLIGAPSGVGGLRWWFRFYLGGLEKVFTLPSAEKNSYLWKVMDGDEPLLPPGEAKMLSGYILSALLVGHVLLPYAGGLFRSGTKAANETRSSGRVRWNVQRKSGGEGKRRKIE